MAEKILCILACLFNDSWVAMGFEFHFLEENVYRILGLESLPDKFLYPLGKACGLERQARKVILAAMFAELPRRKAVICSFCLGVDRQSRESTIPFAFRADPPLKPLL